MNHVPWEHVLWLGGPPGSGKTTIATRLARRHGLRVYSADTRTWVHRDRAIAAGSRAAQRWDASSPDDRWKQWKRTAAETLEVSLHRERGPMVIDDLASLPTSPMIIAEGSTLPACILETVDVVEDLFAGALVSGPRAGSLHERRQLLRELNEAIVVQVHGYHEHPWASGDPGRVTRSFICECGDQGCESDVHASVGDVAARPVLAPGHGAQNE